MVVEVDKRFVIFGVYKDTNKKFWFKKVNVLIDNRDVLYLGLLPTFLYFKNEENLLEYKYRLNSEHKVKEIKDLLKKKHGENGVL